MVGLRHVHYLVFKESSHLGCDVIVQAVPDISKTAVPSKCHKLTKQHCDNSKDTYLQQNQCNNLNSQLA